MAVVACQANAQLRTPLSPNVEPFSIARGSTFAASGHGAAPRSPEKLSAIASDLREAQQIISQFHVDGRSLKPGELTKSGVTGMLRVLDPHSHYYDAAEWDGLLDEQRSSYSGMGATIATFERNGVNGTYVLSTFPGSPAARAGLRFGDRVIAVNGKEIAGDGSDEVRDKLRGPTGSAFRLTVERSATKRVETIGLRRERVAQPSIPDSFILRWGVGYIDLSEGFTYTTADEFNAALGDLKRQGARSLVLDLRGNGGGIVDQAVKVAERFLPAGTLILTQRGRSRIDNRVWRSRNAAPETMPLVVLVDEDTASASEIVAGAFQDNDRAIIVGQRTFGKGLVQSVIELPSGSGLTLTSARYLTPSGRSIQRDYSKVDLYDYFHHKTPAAAADSAFTAHTLTDRTVYGGDGIQPDEAVKTENLGRTQAALLDPLFFFACEAASGRVAGHANYRVGALSFGRRVSPADLPISDSLVAAFNDFASKATNGGFSPEVLRNETAFIRLRLRYNLAMAAFGTVSANQVLTDNDPQVAKGMEALPRAAQLAQGAARANQRVGR
jgi:carboxyl-terminal processing protease